MIRMIKLFTNTMNTNLHRNFVYINVPLNCNAVNTWGLLPIIYSCSSNTTNTTLRDWQCGKVEAPSWISLITQNTPWVALFNACNRWWLNFITKSTNTSSCVKASCNLCTKVPTVYTLIVLGMSALWPLWAFIQNAQFSLDHRSYVWVFFCN